MLFDLFLLADYTQLYQVSETEKVTETLQLFPLNSFGESEPKNMRVPGISYTEEEQINHPPLDLRLSFM